MVRDEPNDQTVIERVDPLVGETLGDKYRVEFRIASGGFGAIYCARDLATMQELAVKVVHPRLARDPGVAARFRREGETLITLRSPHTITAYDVGETSDGMLYMVLELLRGENLFERFSARGPVPWPRMVAIARGVCDSLAEAHALGIVHRDLKPTNLHLERVGDDEDFVKVLDFGIAKILQTSQLDSADLTTAGIMIGTLDYMSPEQMVGGEITGAADIYALGIVIYEMITGRRPFAVADTASAALAAALKPPPPMASLALVPTELDRVVMRCLARDARDRYATAVELAEALARVAGSAGPVTETTAVMEPAAGEPTRVMRRVASDGDATTVTPIAELAGRVTRPFPSTSVTVVAKPEAGEPTAPGWKRSPANTTPWQEAPPPPPALPPWPVPRPAELPALQPRPGDLGPFRLAPPLELLRPETLRGVAVPPQPAGPGGGDPSALDRRDRGFEIDRVVARDRMVRRAVWLIVVAVVAIIAVVLATRL